MKIWDSVYISELNWDWLYTSRFVQRIFSYKLAPLKELFLFSQNKVSTLREFELRFPPPCSVILIRLFYIHFYTKCHKVNTPSPFYQTLQQYPVLFTSGLKLPPLNQILDYHPPSLRNLFQIETISTGQPVIKWQQGITSISKRWFVCLFCYESRSAWAEKISKAFLGRF